MPQAAEPTNAQIEAAFVALRRPDWPATLLELRLAASRYGCVVAAARHLADGGQLTALDLSGPLTPRTAPAAHPARRPAAADTRPLLPTRRSSDTHHYPAHDGKALAAGERPDQEP